MRRLIGIALATLVPIASAYADAIFTTGNDLSNFTVIVVPPATAAPNTVLRGTLTGGGHTAGIEFKSTTDTLVSTSGSSGLTASDGLINDISLMWPHFGFTGLLINPLEINIPSSTTSPIAVMVSVCKPAGTSCLDQKFEDFVYQGRPNGNNFLTIGTKNGEILTGVRVFSEVGFKTLNQVRVSLNGIVPDLPTEPPPPPPEAVPEPSSMLLLGSGLLVFTQVVRRKLLSLVFGTRSA